MDGRPSRLLVHPSGRSASKEFVPEEEDACSLLLRCWLLHLLEVGSRVLWLSVEVCCLLLRVLPEGL